jgi:Flp pilus assembly protein TadG
MRAAAIVQRLRHSLQRFVGDSEGVSALEFAIILPFMATLYLGSVELGEGLSIQFKSTLAARTVADLASQYVSIDNATMSNILGAASTVVTPYSASSMIVTVSEVTTNASGQGTITWSDSLNGTARPVGATVTLPAALQTPNMTLIWGEVTYPYAPQFGYVLTGTISVYQSIFFYPRLSSSVARVNS